MEKIEIIKTKIDFFKSLLLAFLTAFFGVFAYIGINFKSLEKGEFLIACSGALVLFIALIVLLLLVLQNFKILKGYL